MDENLIEVAVEPIESVEEAIVDAPEVAEPEA